MPDGARHFQEFKKGYIVAIPVAVAMGIADIIVGVSYVVGYSSHRWWDNDSGMMSITEADGRLVRELPVLGNFLFGMKCVYKSFFRKMHRKFIDHFPGISTLVRMMLILWLPVYIMDNFGIYMFSVEWLKAYFGFWLGLSHADAIHYWLDATEKKSGNSNTFLRKYQKK